MVANIGEIQGNASILWPWLAMGDAGHGILAEFVRPILIG
jgi:hypothetical protein